MVFMKSGFFFTFAFSPGFPKDLMRSLIQPFRASTNIFELQISSPDPLTDDRKIRFSLFFCGNAFLLDLNL